MIRFSAEAASELEDAIDWYLSRSMRVAGRFHQTFSSVLLHIESDPDHLRESISIFNLLGLLDFRSSAFFARSQTKYKSWQSHIQVEENGTGSIANSSTCGV